MVVQVIHTKIQQAAISRSLRMRLFTTKTKTIVVHSLARTHTPRGAHYTLALLQTSGLAIFIF